jgi:hypothetical protein
MDDQPSLGQFIWLVRRELQWAQEVDRDQPLRFDVDSVELDLAVEATTTKKGGGGLDLKVLGVGLSAGGGAEAARQQTNTIHVVLSASDTGGKKWQVSAEDREPPVRRAEALPTSTPVPEENGPAARSAAAANREPPVERAR